MIGPSREDAAESGNKEQGKVKEVVSIDHRDLFCSLVTKFLFHIRFLLFDLLFDRTDPVTMLLAACHFIYCHLQVFSLLRPYDIVAYYP